MSSIKPPSGRPPTPPSGGGSPAEGSGRVGAEFRELVEGAGRSTGPEGAAGAGQADALQALASSVQAGEVSAAQAVEQLVERVAGELAHRLSPSQRDELLGLLRQAVATDPALADLRRALEPPTG